MHVPDGFLSPEVCAATGAAAAAAVGLSVYKLRDGMADRVVPLTGMTAALVFAGQMVNFPLGLPVSGHLIGGVLAGMIVGPWAGCLAITMVLVVQRFLFSDGGLYAMGANILHMAVIGSIGGYAVATVVRRMFRKEQVGILVGAVVASWVTVIAAAALFCLEFRLSHSPRDFKFGNIFALMIAIHSLIGIGEALITGCVLAYVLRQRPDLIVSDASQARGLAGPISRVTVAGIVVALCVGAFVAPFASQLDDGLEHVAKQHGFAEMAASSRTLVSQSAENPATTDSAQPAESHPAPERLGWSVFADYSAIPLSIGGWQGLSVSVAGVVGTLSVLILALALGRAAGPRSKPVEAGRE
jgi:cobalt/nickel transport system permease protein